MLHLVKELISFMAFKPDRRDYSFPLSQRCAGLDIALVGHEEGFYNVGQLCVRPGAKIQGIRVFNEQQAEEMLQYVKECSRENLVCLGGNWDSVLTLQQGKKQGPCMTLNGTNIGLKLMQQKLYEAVRLFQNAHIVRVFPTQLAVLAHMLAVTKLTDGILCCAFSDQVCAVAFSSGEPKWARSVQIGARENIQEILTRFWSEACPKMPARVVYWRSKQFNGDLCIPYKVEAFESDRFNTEALELEVLRYDV